MPGRALALFSDQPRLTVDDVAQRLRIPKSDALAAIRALAAEGAIERRPGSDGGTGLWRLAEGDARAAATWPGDTAWLALDALLDAAEAAGADLFASPWWEARAAGESAICARSAEAFDRASDELRRLLESAGAADEACTVSII